MNAPDRDRQRASAPASASATPRPAPTLSVAPAEVREAIAAELAATPEHHDFKVLARERDGRLWRITLAPDYAYAEGQFAPMVLDESFDGASVWWGGPPKGVASVLAVVSEDDQIILKDATATPPAPDQLIRLYPPRFLNALADCWADDAWAAQALAGLPDLAAPQPVTSAPLTGQPFRWLRAAQRQALALTRQSSAFLWGPPGTGKTTCLGVMLAEYLDVNPEARVLLLSSTNHAVDQATLAVDKALQKGRREALRPRVQRLGTRFGAALYAGREHLIPVPSGSSREGMAQLARAEAERPPTRDLLAFDEWAARVAKLRAALRSESLQVLQQARLVSMTTTRAAYTLKTLRTLPPFDLLVFDEASQVSLAHALALMPLGRARLFAGDPQQLSPVLRSADRGARRWLGRSPFSLKPRGGPSVALLDEQSRMAAPISELVSHCFYDGALRVAADAQADPAWQTQRALAFDGIATDLHVHLEHLAQDGGWSAAQRGPVRVTSAAHIAARVAAALQAGEVEPQQLIVLTPFRAQRALIRARLAALGVDSVKVSTVHRAQGSEAPVVIFDPVDGRQPFLCSEEAQRLINVALSRAQAKVIVYLSPGDAANPWLAQILNRLRLAGDARAATPLAAWMARPGFPANCVGERVAIARHVGEVRRVSPDGTQLWLVNEASGAEQVFDLGHLRRKWLAENQPVARQGT
ncbi:MAG: DEAD/DEAH box helicase [Leptothrix sp. (in: b-proteobacteria)]